MLGIALGAIIFFSFVMVASVISTYTGTAYHTCLYLWARETETRPRGRQLHACPGPRAAGYGTSKCNRLTAAASLSAGRRSTG